MYLPPYSSDFSGVCSVLFDLGGLVILHDAACCTKNYVDYEEPRWARERNNTFCSQLRSIDAVLGNDDKLVDKAVEAAKKINPPFIAVLGSPVPAIIGTDMDGIAMEIENITGIPTIGFDTCGFKYYDNGISMALKKLIQKFAPKEKPETTNSINLLGITPLDFSANENCLDFINFFEKEGFKVNCSFAMKYTLEDLKNILKAKVNIVLTTFAIDGAKYLYKTYGIPYVIACPMGKKFSKEIIENIHKAVISNENITISTQNDIETSNKILIVWEQTIANSLRNALYLNGCKDEIIVASFLKMNKATKIDNDIELKSEKEFIDLLKQNNFNKIIADPLILNIPYCKCEKKFPIVHPAISSNLFLDKTRLFLQNEFEKLIDDICL